MTGYFFAYKGVLVFTVLGTLTIDFFPLKLESTLQTTQGSMKETLSYLKCLNLESARLYQVLSRSNESIHGYCLRTICVVKEILFLKKSSFFKNHILVKWLVYLIHYHYLKSDLS